MRLRLLNELRKFSNFNILPAKTTNFELLHKKIVFINLRRRPLLITNNLEINVNAVSKSNYHK